MHRLSYIFVLYQALDTDHIGSAQHRDTECLTVEIGRSRHLSRVEIGQNSRCLHAIDRERIACIHSNIGLGEEFLIVFVAGSNGYYHRKTYRIKELFHSFLPPCSYLHIHLQPKIRIYVTANRSTIILIIGRIIPYLIAEQRNVEAIAKQLFRYF